MVAAILDKRYVYGEHARFFSNVNTFTEFVWFRLSNIFMLFNVSGNLSPLTLSSWAYSPVLVNSIGMLLFRVYSIQSRPK